MNITFEELRNIKHKLPKGSVGRIARELNIEEQTVRNYFGGAKFGEGHITGKHIEPGPKGGIVNLKDTEILNVALRILKSEDEIGSKEIRQESDPKLERIKPIERIKTPIIDSPGIEQKKGKLIVRASKIGSVEEVIEILTKIETAYNAFYILENLFFNGPKYVIRHFDLESIMAIKPNENHKLQVNEVTFNSPGFWEFLGNIGPLVQLREYLKERHDRTKDREFKNKKEKEKMRIENERLQIDNDFQQKKNDFELKIMAAKVMTENIRVLEQMNYTKEEIKMLTMHLIVNPITDLNSLLEEGQLESFELMEKE